MTTIFELSGQGAVCRLIVDPSPRSHLGWGMDLDGVTRVFVDHSHDEEILMFTPRVNTHKVKQVPDDCIARIYAEIGTKPILFYFECVCQKHGNYNI